MLGPRVIDHHVQDAAFAAIERGISMIDPSDQVNSMIGTSMGLFWACVLDENVQDRPGYKSRRNSSPDGRLLIGMRVARNALTHGAAVVSSTRTGIYWPPDPQRGLAWREVVWSPWLEILWGLDATPSAAAKRQYLADLEGRAVADTMTQALTWLRLELQTPPVSSLGGPSVQKRR